MSYPDDLWRPTVTDDEVVDDEMPAESFDLPIRPRAAASRGDAVDKTELKIVPLARPRSSPWQWPARWERARLRVSWTAVAGVVAVAVVALSILGIRVWHARSQAVPVPLSAVSTQVAEAGDTAVGAPTGRPSGGARALPSPGATSLSATGPAQGVVIVYVVGEVKRPGVVRLGPDGRVEEAVRRTGGLTAKADVTSVNLARKAVDGEQITVLARGAVAAAGAASPRASGAASGGAPGAAGGPVDLNSADSERLQSLPGVGPVLAGRIVEWRTQHGRFSTVDELGEVSGIGDKTLERLRPLVRV